MVHVLESGWITQECARQEPVNLGNSPNSLGPGKACPVQSSAVAVGTTGGVGGIFLVPLSY